MSGTLFVPGASSDIGRALIGLIGARYDKCIAHCFRGAERLQETASAAGLSVTGLRDAVGMTILSADLTSAEETENLLTELTQAGIVPDDIVYLPSAPFSYCQFKKLEPVSFEDALSLTLMPAVRILHALLPAMAKRGSGHVVTMLSAVTDGMPPKFLSAYTTAKYALLGLMRSLAAEYGEKGILINGISPVMTDTRFLAQVPEKIREIAAADRPDGRLLSPEEAAQAIAVLLEASGADAPCGTNRVIA